LVFFTINTVPEYFPIVPFPVIPIATASVAIVAVVGAGLIVYFKKRRVKSGGKS
jgi:hypothetical protein